MPLPEPSPDLRSLDLLVSVGELGSINAAAEAHGITQPAASMRLRALERLLQIELLERSTTGARLTPAGAATVEWAGAVLVDMRELLTGTAALRADKSSHLQLAASLTVAEYMVPRWLQQLAVEIPGAQVSLQMGNTAHVAELVLQGEVDLGFIEGPRPPGRLRSTKVVADELIVVVPPAHPWARRRRPLTARDLASTALVLREPGSGTREVLTEALGAAGLEVTVAMELASTTAIKAATIAGAGPAVISALAVRSELQAGQLLAVPCEGISLRRVIRAIWAGTRPPTGPSARLLAMAAREGTPE